MLVCNIYSLFSSFIYLLLVDPTRPKSIALLYNSEDITFLRDKKVFRKKTRGPSHQFSYTAQSRRRNRSREIHRKNPKEMVKFGKRC